MNQLGGIESEYVLKVSLEHRKKFAQFFTPQPIAGLMADWLLKNESLKTVLEPAFGLGGGACSACQKTGFVDKRF